MGILNVTPDSFSDGGAHATVEEAVASAHTMVADGAAILDVGGESTRPGAGRVDPAEEQRRVLPVVRELASAGVTVSVDTMNAETARLAVQAGATMVNDVSGGLSDPGMVRVVADAGVDFVVMHWRGHSADMNSLARYGSVAADVRHELVARIGALTDGGVAPQKILLDPGIGFAKNSGHNWEMLARLDELTSLGHRVLVGASRKRFLGELLPEGSPATDRDAATAVVSALAAQAGAWAVRVHDVASTRAALAVQEAWRGGRG